MLMLLESIYTRWYKLIRAVFLQIFKCCWSEKGDIFLRISNVTLAMMTET